MSKRTMQEATFPILTALAAGSQHAYGIITDVTGISDGRVRLRAGTPYTALDRLREDGLIEVDREEVVDSRLRRYYCLTPGRGAVGRRGRASTGERVCRDVASRSRWTGGDGMTGQAQLERRYRRLLAWYPQAFREEHEEEMLVVLMASARNGRCRPGPADSANLIANALLMRLRPRAKRSTPTVFWAVRLMALGAVLELAAVLTVVATRGELSSAIARHFPAYSAAHVHTLVHGHVVTVAIGAPIVPTAWLWLAWANDRGHKWARGLFCVLFGLTSVSLLAAISQHAATFAPADLIAGWALWLVAFATLVLVLSKPSDPYYRARPAHP